MNAERDDNVHVYLRFCPIEDLEDTSESCAEVLNNNTKVKLNLAKLPNEKLESDFLYDKIFDVDVGQREVYDYIGSPLVKEFLLGNNCCIFTYGEIGTGKTYTLLGPGGYKQKFNDDISSLSSCGVSEAPLRPRHSQVPPGLPPRLLNFPEELKSSNHSSSKQKMGIEKKTEKKNLSPIERMMHANQTHIKGVNPIIGNQPSTQKIRRKSSKKNSKKSSDDDFVIDGIEDAMAQQGSETNNTGILPHIMKTIFDNIFNEIMVKFSMYEIHQEEIRDLLGPKESKDDLAIKKTGLGIEVDGITQVGCTTESQVMGLIERGIENRNSSTARPNYGQNFFVRSHIVFEITSEYYDKKRGIEVTNTFRIVDLAGFDDGFLDSREGPDGMLLNRSLDILSKAVAELADAQPNVAYNDSKLTQILQDRIGGDCKTTLLLTASPSYLHVSETLKTLEFGKQVRKIVKKATLDDQNSLSVYKAKLEVSEKNRRELMEIITELQRVGVKIPKRRSTVSMISILEEDDDESIGSFKSEKLSSVEKTEIRVDLQHVDESTGGGHGNSTRTEDDLAAAREELKSVSVLLQSASEKMDMDLNAAKKLAISNVANLQSDTRSVLTSEEIDANIEAAIRDLNVKSTASSTGILENHENAHDLKIDRIIEEKDILIESLKDELKCLKREKEDFHSTINKQEEDLKIAQKEIVALTEQIKDLEQSLKDKNEKSICKNNNEQNRDSVYAKDAESTNSVVSFEKSETIRVCLRLRPMNKLEISKRSRNCIVVQEDPQKFAVDSPLDGNYDFTYDKVFSPSSSQSMIYEYVGVPIVLNLLSGINCCLIAYGLRGSGKTTTLFGSALSAPDSQSGGTTFSNIDGETIEERDDFGILPRVVKGIFKGIAKKSDKIEFTVRCSFTAINFEKIYDLLDPNIKKSIYVEDGDHGVSINGACKPFCFEESDVYALILRGRASYSALSNHSKLQVGCSSLIFMIEIQQQNSESGSTKIAQLQVADIYGYDAIRTSQIITTDVKIVHQSISSLNNIVDHLNKGNSNIPYDDAKLTSMLKNAFGGNCKTTLIVTASPSSFNISKTVKTIRFGQEARKITNNPKINYEYSTNLYKKWLISCEIRLGELTDFVLELAREMASKRQLSTFLSTQLWKSIIAIVKEEAVEWNPCRKALVKGKIEEIKKLGTKWKMLSNYLSKKYSFNDSGKSENTRQIKSLLSDVQCEAHVLRTQNKLLIEENRTNKDVRQSLENELKSIKLKISVMENKLMHNEFKEKMAGFLLKHLRKLCRRLQNSLTQNKSEEILSLIESVKGMPDLTGLVDIDTVLIDFGLLSSEEMDDDSDDQGFLNDMRSVYGDRSSKSFTLNNRSLRSLFSGSTGVNMSTNSDKSKSEQDYKFFNPEGFLHRKQISTGMIINESNPDKPTEWLRGKETENELRRMTLKCIDLKIRLTEEQSHVEELANRTGPFMRKGLSQEVIKLRRDHESLTNSLKAAALKLQEIQVVNETLETQNLESKKHITFLENDFHDLQSIFRETIAESHDKERQLREQLRKIENRIGLLFEPQRQGLQSQRSNRRVIPKMNVPLKGLSSPIASQEKKSYIACDKRGQTLHQVRKPISKAKRVCRKAYRSAKYIRRSRKNGTAIAGLNKDKLKKLYKKLNKLEGPIFTGSLDLHESMESRITRNSHFILNNRD